MSRRSRRRGAAGLLAGALFGAVLFSGPAEAADFDFSGFYAGINAGAALDTGSRPHGGPQVVGSGTGLSGAPALPPSAAAAARTLRVRPGASVGTVSSGR